MVQPEHLQPDANALALVPQDVAERGSVLPLVAREEALVVLMADPWDRTRLGERRFLTQRRLCTGCREPWTAGGDTHAGHGCPTP